MLNRRSLMGGIIALPYLSRVAFGQDSGLIDRARAEGQVSYYTVKATELARALSDAFTARFGIRVNLFRTGGTQIAQKLSLELRSRRVECDIFESNDPTLATQLFRQGVIEPFEPQNAAGLDPNLRHPQFAWHATGISYGHLLGNRQRMDVSAMPKTFAALADSAWREKLAWASPNYGSSQLVVLKGLLEMHGWELIEALARNQTMVVRGWPEAESAVASGERAIAGDVSSRSSVGVRSGIPFEIIYPEEGCIVYLAAMAIMKAAPRPNAAKLLMEFCLSDEGQRLYMQEFNYPVRTALGAPPGLLPLDRITLHYVNWDELLDQRTAMTRRWTQLMER